MLALIILNCVYYMHLLFEKEVPSTGVDAKSEIDRVAIAYLGNGNTRPCIMAYFYRLRVDIDDLEARTERPMKLIAVLPQAHIGLSSLSIDGPTAPHMVEDI